MTSTLRAGRQLVVTVLVLAAAAGCASGGEAAASCSGEVRYDGHRYLPVGDPDFAVGARLGTATVLECDDTPNDPGVTIPKARTGAYEVQGRDPADAIAVGDTPAGARLMEPR